MNFLFLHGAPGSGKLTIAKAILNRVDGKLFDNHVSIDLARHLFDFDTPAFWDLVNEVRYLSIEKAALAKIPLLIYTCCYSHPQDLPQLERLEEILSRHGSKLLPVYLICSRETLRHRIGLPDRAERKKLCSVEGLDNVLGKWNLIKVPRENCLCVDSEKLAPHESANLIIGHFGIGA